MIQKTSEKAKLLLKDHIGPFLYASGFARKGTDYSRPKSECVQHIFIRFDRHGADELKCYYFANLFYPVIEKTISLGGIPPESVNTFGKQMGHLKDHNRFEEWKIGRWTRIAALGDRFKSDIERYGLPFLDRFSQLSEVCDALESGELFNLDIRDAKLILAAAYHSLGDGQKAMGVLDEMIEALEGKPQVSRFLALKEYLKGIQR